MSDNEIQGLVVEYEQPITVDEKISTLFDEYKTNPIDWMNVFHLDMKDIPSMDIEKLAEHADLICKGMHKNNPEDWDAFVRHNFYESLNEDSSIDKWNATSFANLAYVSIHAPDDIKNNIEHIMKIKIGELSKKITISWSEKLKIGVVGTGALFLVSYFVYTTFRSLLY